MGIVAPIHVEAVGLADLRFFWPPQGGRDFPWISIDDLQACMGLSRELRRHFKARMRRSPWSQDITTVAVDDGIANIVPHFVAQGLIDAMTSTGHVSAHFYAAYTGAGAKALGALTSGLNAAEMLDYIAAAWKAAGGAPRFDARLSDG